MIGTRVLALCAAAIVTPAYAADHGWVFATHDFATTIFAMPYVGNGYVGQRVSPSGAGYLGNLGDSGWPLRQPRGTQAIVAGVYAQGPFSKYYPGVTKRAIAVIPTWSALPFTTPSGTFSPATATAADIDQYAQQQDLRTGTVTTSGVWTAPGGERTRFRYTIFADRARKHVGVIALTVTPEWSGRLQVASGFDGATAQRMETIPAAGHHPAGGTQLLTRTMGSNVIVAESALLEMPRSAPADGPRRVAGEGSTTTEVAAVRVTAGTSYRFVKFVGIATSHDTAKPGRLAAREAVAAAALGFEKLSAENRASWSAVWRADVEVEGNPALQAVVRASLYNLNASMRPDAPGLIGPSGLSSDGYAGMAFWDSELWMFPALLAADPASARPMLDYRFGTLDAAKRNAAANGLKGAFYPWTAADDGRFALDCYGTTTSAETDTVTADPNKSCSEQIHLQADIALAHWNYYLATGDRRWLTQRGEPVLRAIADFYASRVTPLANGGYALRKVQASDEYHVDVDNDAFTNAAAATALRHASAAALLVGRTPPASWSRVAAGLVESIPYDRTNKVHLEFEGYDGSKVKQADVALLTYPLGIEMDPAQARADIEYYLARTDPDGPAMTDAIHAIATARDNQPGCAAYTFLLRSYQPQLRAPFYQLSETASGAAMSFLTGTGGLLQQFSYGLSGLQFRENAVFLDPSLPPQLTSVTLHQLQWRGRSFSVRIGRLETTVTLRRGQAMPIETPAGLQILRPGASARIATRRPDEFPTDNVGRCQRVDASASEPAYPAVAANDGSAATSWSPAGRTGEWVVTLDHAVAVGKVSVTRSSKSEFDYSVEASTDARIWETLSRSAADQFVGPARAVKFVRLTIPPQSLTEAPRIGEVEISARR